MELSSGCLHPGSRSSFLIISALTAASIQLFSATWCLDQSGAAEFSPFLNCQDGHGAGGEAAAFQSSTCGLLLVYSVSVHVRVCM